MHNTPPASRRRFFRTSAGMGAVLAAATSTGASGASTPPHAAVRVRSGFVAGPSTYYEVLEPVAKTRKPPMVLIHGGAHTGSCYMATADGRPGWAPFFAAQGYQVVVPDWAGTGRSGYIPYDDLDNWRGPYPPDVFASQFEKLVDGWSKGIEHLERACSAAPAAA